MFFFFFKKKTAYEMRISDWSSDVCSSDLRCPTASARPPRRAGEGWRNLGKRNAPGRSWPRSYFQRDEKSILNVEMIHREPYRLIGTNRQGDRHEQSRHGHRCFRAVHTARRSEERRGGKRCVSTCKT